MPARERIRVDLKQAIDNLDGTVTSRSFPLQLIPAMGRGYITTMVDYIEISPNSASVEVWAEYANGRTDKYMTYGSGFLPRGILCSYEPMILRFFNLNTTSGVTVVITTVSYRYNEPQA